MKRLAYLLMCALLCSFTVSAAAEESTAPNKPAASTASILEDNPTTITLEEMQTALEETDIKEDVLYMKLVDNQVEVYKGAAKSSSLRKQLLATAPENDILRLYTTNKNTYLQVFKMFKNYESSGKHIGGCYVLTDDDKQETLQNGKRVYRFWLLKQDASSDSVGSSRSDDSISGGVVIRPSHRIGIGIGWWPWFTSSHYHHRDYDRYRGHRPPPPPPSYHRGGPAPRHHR